VSAALGAHAAQTGVGAAARRRSASETDEEQHGTGGVDGGLGDERPVRSLPDRHAAADADRGGAAGQPGDAGVGVERGGALAGGQRRHGQIPPHAHPLPPPPSPPPETEMGRRRPQLAAQQRGQ
jgi:hypothetical protein